jgi:ferric-dicitrate binding protein FerR (iron transport regulator)
MNEEIDIIFARYFSGNATEEEMQTLDKWLAKSDENDKLFQQMSVLYQYAGKSEEMQTIDTDNAWAKFNTHISEKQKTGITFKLPSFLKAAAAIAVLMISVFALYYLFNQPSEINRLLAEENIVEHKISENKLVTLFPNAEIVYHSKNRKEIILKGKATFNIDTETTVPESIIVQAGETFIKDIGTIFTVDATNPAQFIKVEVTEGEVLFYTSTNAGVSVKENESAVYDVQTKEFFMIEKTNHTQYSQEIVNELVFNNTPLFDVVELLKKHYGIDINIASNELKEICLNASFDANESVENILQIITTTFDAKLSKKDNIFIIKQ